MDVDEGEARETEGPCHATDMVTAECIRVFCRSIRTTIVFLQVIAGNFQEVIVKIVLECGIGQFVCILADVAILLAVYCIGRTIFIRHNHGTRANIHLGIAYLGVGTIARTKHRELWV